MSECLNETQKIIVALIAILLNLLFWLIFSRLKPKSKASVPHWTETKVSTIIEKVEKKLEKAVEEQELTIFVSTLTPEFVWDILSKIFQHPVTKKKPWVHILISQQAIDTTNKNAKEYFLEKLSLSMEQLRFAATQIAVDFVDGDAVKHKLLEEATKIINDENFAMVMFGEYVAAAGANKALEAASKDVKNIARALKNVA